MNELDTTTAEPLLTRLADRIGLEGRPWLESLFGLAVMLVAAILAYLLARHLVLPMIVKAIRVTRTRWDDRLLAPKTLRRLCLVAPLVVLLNGLPAIPHLPAELVSALERLLPALVALIATITVVTLLGAAERFYSQMEMSEGRAIKGYVQVVQIVVWLFGLIVIVAELVDRSPVGLLTGLGALTAVLMLIFRTTLLSLVASVQLEASDLLRLGDWIIVPSANAEGEVIDMALHTIKVQGGDRAVYSIPTYKLIEEAFCNWRYVHQSGGRRIKRELRFDVGSLRFLEPSELDASLVSPDAGRASNLELFRHYAERYLQEHEQIHSDGFTLLVRSVPPGPTGVGLEIMAFATATDFAGFESIQAQLFEHLMAVAPQFGLRLYQGPTGADVSQVAERVVGRG